MTTPLGIVHIVDDEAGMRKALTRLLSAEGFEVRGFASARDFLVAYRPEEVACLLLDVTMPEISGIELQERLERLGHALPIVFLTGNRSVPLSVRAMKTGALDYLTKPVNDADLLRAVRAALELAAKRKAEQAALAGLRARYDGLTPREREVMAHVIAGQLNKQIAADLGTGEQNIKIHRSRVMEKMGVQSVTDLVRIAEKLGIGPSHPV